MTKFGDNLNFLTENVKIGQNFNFRRNGHFLYQMSICINISISTKTLFSNQYFEQRISSFDQNCDFWKSGFSSDYSIIVENINMVKIPRSSFSTLPAGYINISYHSPFLHHRAFPEIRWIFPADWWPAARPFARWLLELGVCCSACNLEFAYQVFVFSYRIWTESYRRLLRQLQRQFLHRS